MAIGYGCSSTSDWAYFNFSNAPNLSNDETEQGYSTSISRISWDGKPTTIRLHQDWGDSSLHFRSKADVARLIARNELVVEFDWHGQNAVHFRASLSGSSIAIQRAREVCGIAEIQAAIDSDNLEKERMELERQEIARKAREQRESLREHMAIGKWRNNPVAQVRILLAQEAVLDEAYVNNVYPVLSFLVRQEEPNLDAMRMLLEAGADPEKATSRTALKIAVADGKQAAAFLLIEYGADPHLKTGLFTTPCQTFGISDEFKNAIGCLE